MPKAGDVIALLFTNIKTSEFGFIILSGAFEEKVCQVIGSELIIRTSSVENGFGLSVEFFVTHKGRTQYISPNSWFTINGIESHIFMFEHSWVKSAL
jgi:hypothetical protein